MLHYPSLSSHLFIILILPPIYQHVMLIAAANLTYQYYYYYCCCLPANTAIIAIAGGERGKRRQSCVMKKHNLCIKTPQEEREAIKKDERDCKLRKSLSQRIPMRIVTSLTNAPHGGKIKTENYHQNEQIYTTQVGLFAQIHKKQPL